MLILGFLVKFPMYGLHFWLPKAHVEAPVGGSIILASLLLKLGGFGIILVLPASPSCVLTTLLASVRLFGGVCVAVLCTRQRDLKVLIAYSSVRHLRLVIRCIMMKTLLLFIGAMVIIVSHGLSSPGIFYGAAVLYKRTNSRNIFLNIGGRGAAPAFTLWWFLLAIANIGAPPMLNLIGELVSITGVLTVNLLFCVQTIFLIFLGGAYTLILYASTQRGQKKNNFNSFTPLYFQENMGIFRLIVPLVLMGPIISLF
jgi:NADH-ubiquinone oxidoreductase chain 4